eukprot:7388513-Prymnesium_polylepis.1
MLSGWEGADDFNIVLSLCKGGSLFDTMLAAYEAEAPVAEPTARAAFAQIVGALHHCHTRGVYHRDVCLRNLCWADESETTLQLIDFGFAAGAETRSDFAGTAHFAAPEVHNAADADDGSCSYRCAPADVWSAGVCLFAMLATQLPFGGSDDGDDERRELQEKVCAGQWDVEPKCSALAIDLLRGIMCVDPVRRLTLEQVCEHPWVGGAAQMPLGGVESDAPTPVQAKPKPRRRKESDAERRQVEDLVGRMDY